MKKTAADNYILVHLEGKDYQTRIVDLGLNDKGSYRAFQLPEYLLGKTGQFQTNVSLPEIIFNPNGKFATVHKATDLKNGEVKVTPAPKAKPETDEIAKLQKQVADLAKIVINMAKAAPAPAADTAKK